MEEITPKEILLSVAVIVGAFALAVFINPFIKDSMLEDVRRHQNALQVSNDTNIFQYALTTKVGEVFAYGQMSAFHPVTFPELSGTYGVIEKVTERYTRHTRQVCDSRDDDGNCISSHTEVYYTWDTWKRDTLASDYFDFLSVTFPYDAIMGTPNTVDLSSNTVSFSFLSRVYGNYLYEDDDIFSSEGDLRFYYNYLPTQFYASMLVNFGEAGITPVKFYYEQDQHQVFEQKEHSLKMFDVMYYFIVLLVVGGGYFYFAHSYLEIV